MDAYYNELTRLCDLEDQLLKRGVDIKSIEQTMNKINDTYYLFSDALKQSKEKELWQMKEFNLLSRISKLRSNVRYAIQDSQHAVLIQGTSLDKSIKIAQQTEQVGVQIMDDLSQQREQLIHINNQVDQIDTNISRANKYLRQMWMRLKTDKVIIGCIVVILVAIIVMIVYQEVQKK